MTLEDAKADFGSGASLLDVVKKAREMGGNSTGGGNTVEPDPSTNTYYESILKQYEVNGIEFKEVYQHESGRAIITTSKKVNGKWEYVSSRPYSKEGSGNYAISKQLLINIGYSEGTLTDTFLKGLNNTIQTYIVDPALDKSINNERIAKFIAQISVESQFGLRTEEYDYGDNTYFYRTYKSEEKFGDIIDTSNGLRRYCGGGYIMLTGRSNYEAFSNAIGDKEIYNQGINYVAANYAWEAAGWWWQSNGMNKFIDNGATIAEVSKRVNGGINGLNERTSVYNSIIAVLNK